MITSIILKPLKNSGTELNFLPMANYVQQLVLTGDIYQALTFSTKEKHFCKYRK
jgi:hypothetical protein